MTDQMGCHIEASWEAFRRQVVPGYFEPARVEEMRIMFFCGAVSLYEILKEILEQEPNQTTTQTMQQIHDELGAFMLMQLRSNNGLNS